MGCGGDRDKGPPEHTQKWEFITLSDFRATSNWSSVAYLWLWFMALVGIAVYALDTFTAINLLVFDRWSSQIKPQVPFKYSKWIFAACIMLSFALLFYEWLRALRVLRRGGVAESYMDSLAVNVQCMRSQGWRRFLVFTELTKSKKGTDYIAFFVYFTFQTAIRVILAEGPRQYVNAMTLYAVMQAKIEVHGPTQDGHSSVEQLFLNIESLFDDNIEQALILCSMLFTLVIWVISALCLIGATIFYLVFLWHYIPQQDGRLSIYCRRKIDQRLQKIVEYKVRAAMEDEERKKKQAEQKAELQRQKNGGLSQTDLKPQLARQPTLPHLEVEPELPPADEKKQAFGLTRQDTTTTVSTLPPYSSRPPTRQGSRAQISDMPGGRPEMPSRMNTQASTWTNASYEGNAPLLANAGYAGEGGRSSPAPAMPGMPPGPFSSEGFNAPFGQPMPGRQASMATQRSFTPTSNNGSLYSRPPPGPRGPTPGGRGPPVRSNTGFSFDDQQDGYGPPVRHNTQDSIGSLGMHNTPAPSFNQAMDRRPTYGSLHSQQGSFSRPIPRKPSPAYSSAAPLTGNDSLDPHADSYEMTTNPIFTNALAAEPAAFEGEGSVGYMAFNPARTGTASPLPTAPTPAALPTNLQPGPKRDITVASPPWAEDDYFGHVQQLEVPQRSATAPIDAQRLTTGYGDILDDYGDNARNSILPPEPVAVGQPQGIRRPSPPQAPEGMVRSQTAGPTWEEKYRQRQRQQHQHQHQQGGSVGGWDSRF